MPDSRIDARQELLVDVDAHGGGIEEVAGFGVVDAGVADEVCGGGVVARVHAAEAAADEAKEGAGHAGEKDYEGKGGCCFY